LLLLLLLNGRERSQLKNVNRVEDEQNQKRRKKKTNSSSSSSFSSSRRNNDPKEQTNARTSSNNRSPFSTPQNASISALVSSHLRSVKSYSTFGKYVCQSKGATEVSRGRYCRCRCSDDWRREECSSIWLIVVVLHGLSVHARNLMRICVSIRCAHQKWRF